jgi:hypothetical protein
MSTNMVSASLADAGGTIRSRAAFRMIVTVSGLIGPCPLHGRKTVGIPAGTGPPTCAHIRCPGSACVGGRRATLVLPGELQDDTVG